MRKRLYEIIEVARDDDRLSLVYDVFMLVAILVSIVPLAFRGNDTPEFRGDYPILFYLDVVTTLIFIVDYILRLATADYKLNKRSVFSFLRYPFTLWAIIDLVSILPSVPLLIPFVSHPSSGFTSLKLFRLFRSIRSFRVFRAAKALRYSQSFSIILDVIKNSADALLAVCLLAVGYVLISALIIFNVEPETFDSFFKSVYWATVSLTTVGYGDICVITTTGRVIAMISSFFGIAIVALPAGIITAGYMEALNRSKKNKKDGP